MLKTIFFGTPEFAVPTLAALHESGYSPRLVVSQPSRPVGRGKKVQDPPVVAWARSHGLEVRQPEKVRQKDFMAELRELQPDLAVVVAFGQIFRRELLDLPRHGCFNLHGSLLPRYRGAAPIQAAIAAGESITGVTTMRMDTGMDTGPILLMKELTIEPGETSARLAPRLAEVGAALMVETLRRLERGELRAEPQDASLATYAPRLAKSDAVVDWHLEAGKIYNRLRAFTPWPGLRSYLADEPVKILEASVLPDNILPTSTLPTLRPEELENGDEPGVILGIFDGHLAVRAGNGTILGLVRVQRPGRKGIAAKDFYHGARLGAGVRFQCIAL